MNKKIVTMADIAEALHISKVSVHKALNNRHDISDELKQKIINKASEMGYSSMDPLTKLCRHYFYLIPSRFHISTEQFYIPIYAKLQDYMRSIGCTLEMHEINGAFSVSRFLSSTQKFLQKNYCIIIAGQASDEVLKDFESSGVPCVCLDYYSDKHKLNYLYLDNYHAGYYLTNYLIQCGHRRICFFIDINSATTNADKYFGFRKSLVENGIPYSRSMHINLSLSNLSSFTKLELPTPEPTACIFDSDYAAANFIIAMSSRGYKIPEDISIASFDNTALCMETIPRLTSVGVEIKAIIENCYHILLKALKNPSKRYTFTISPQIFIRDSVRDITLLS